MLRPVRRTRRALAAALATVATLALIWPAAITSGRTSSSTDTAATAIAGAPRSHREPSLKGLGVKPLKANTEKRTKPLKHVEIDHANRGNGAGGERTQQAPDTQADITAVPPPSVQVTSSGAPAATSFGPWEGIDQVESGFEPPDPWVAVGPDDVVQTVNTRISFTNREGTKRADSLDVSEFFAFDELKPGDPNHIDGVGDPRFIYDAKHNRWFGITMAFHCGTDGSLGYVLGAISTGGDPTGDYYQFYILYNGFLPDFPGLGTSGDKFAISSNEYVLDDTEDCTHQPTAACVRSGDPPQLPPGCYDGAGIYAFDWTQMLTFPEFPDGTYVVSFDLFSLRPALSPQSTSNTIFVVGEKLLDPPTGNTTSNVAYMTVTGTNAGGGTTLSAEHDLTDLGVVPAFVDPPVPNQPGAEPPASIIDRRPTDAIWQNNVLTFVSTAPCDPAGGAAEVRDCARVAQVNTSSATPTRVQDMLLATSTKDTWYAGIGQSASGILHVVYTESSPTEGMSSFDRYQLPSDAIHTLSAAREIADGGALNYPGSRWGDYVGVAQDPRDTNAVWQGNQYTHSGGTWATRVSELQTAGTTFVGINPVRVLDSRINLGTTGSFLSSTPKTIDIAGRLGIPANAVAITGNLTVTSQQMAGYAALTPLPAVNPATSTLNFPVGDNRANNITSPLSPTGHVSLTYKAGAGKRTHFVLDVTGYFLNNDTGDTFKTLAPVRVLDTRGNVGLTGPFMANMSRQFNVAGVLTVPANAEAVTANLTVVGQTAGGYVSLSTTAPPATPATSTINFPLGDVRANGLTIRLSDAGTIFAVYKAPAGRQAHLILDVTGYYVSDGTGARFVPVTPGRRMDTRGAAPQEGLSGRFTANIGRTLVIEPYQGIPANATAITGNLTVVGQTSPGYVAMTQATTNNPTTSTINFPVGDVRANGVTGPLTAAGTVGLVFKTGGTTHMIMDITGYFR